MNTEIYIGFLIVFLKFLGEVYFVNHKKIEKLNNKIDKLDDRNYYLTIEYQFEKRKLRNKYMFLFTGLKILSYILLTIFTNLNILTIIITSLILSVIFNITGIKKRLICKIKGVKL